MVQTKYSPSSRPTSSLLDLSYITAVYLSIILVDYNLPSLNYNDKKPHIRRAEVIACAQFNSYECGKSLSKKQKASYKSFRRGVCCLRHALGPLTRECYSPTPSVLSFM